MTSSIMDALNFLIVSGYWYREPCSVFSVFYPGVTTARADFKNHFFGGKDNLKPWKL